MLHQAVPSRQSDDIEFLQNELNILPPKERLLFQVIPNLRCEEDHMYISVNCCSSETLYLPEFRKVVQMFDDDDPIKFFSVNITKTEEDEFCITIVAFYDTCCCEDTSEALLGVFRSFEIITLRNGLKAFKFV
jgi:hypothetical protein